MLILFFAVTVLFICLCTVYYSLNWSCVAGFSSCSIWNWMHRTRFWRPSTSRSLPSPTPITSSGTRIPTVRYVQNRGLPSLEPIVGKGDVYIFFTIPDNAIPSSLWSSDKRSFGGAGADGLLQHAEHSAARQGPGLCLCLAGDRLPQGLHWPHPQPHPTAKRSVVCWAQPSQSWIICYGECRHRYLYGINTSTYSTKL